MKNYVRFALNFTTTKLLSYLIFTSGTIVALVLKDKTVFVEATMHAAILQGLKAASEIKIGKNGTTETIS
jgi:hypothetical protein